MLLVIGSRRLEWLATVERIGGAVASFKKGLPGASARKIGSHAAIVSHPKSSAGRRRPPSALRNGRGGALAEQFGSVTRRFPWSVIVIEALSPMVFIHTRRIIIVPSNQPLLGFLAPPFESHCRFGSHIYQLVSHGRKAVAGGASDVRK